MTSALRGLAAAPLLAGCLLLIGTAEPASALETCAGLSPTLTGTDADDILTGTDGDDVIVGGSGNDTIHGGAGNDVICGDVDGQGVLEGGEDRLFGGPGDDRLYGGRDRPVKEYGESHWYYRGDVIAGGPGDD